MTDDRQTSSLDRPSEADARALKTLKLERRQLKTTLTRFETWLNGSPDLDLVSQRLERIKVTLPAFETVQREIAAREALSDDDGQELMEFEDRYDVLMLRASRLLRPASAAASDPSTIAMPSDRATIASDSSGRSLPQFTAKLPAISLPTFAGDYLQWESFRDMYVSLVHANEGLSNVQRFHYLKSSLRGEALAPLDTYAITDANYVEAWREMQERYNNKRVLLTNHWHAFSALAPVAKESASALKGLLSGIARTSHALKSLNRSASAWEDWLVYFTVERLDANTRRDWERSLGQSTDPPTFEALKSFVDGRIRSLEALPPAAVKQPTGPRPAPPLRTAKAHHTSSASGCAQCKGAHYLGYCPQVLALAPSQRRAAVSKLRVCFNCLRPGHRREACTSTRGCSSCNERHHTILHDAASSASMASSQSRPATPSRQGATTTTTLTEGTTRSHHTALSSAGHPRYGLREATVTIRTDGRGASAPGSRIATFIRYRGYSPDSTASPSSH